MTYQDYNDLPIMAPGYATLTYSCNNDVYIKTKESEYLFKIKEDVDEIIKMAERFNMKPFKLDIISIKRFSFYNFGFTWYYRAILTFRKVEEDNNAHNGTEKKK